MVVEAMAIGTDRLARLSALAQSLHADRQAPEIIKLELQGEVLNRGWHHEVKPRDLDDIIFQVTGRRPAPEPIPTPRPAPTNSKNSSNSNRAEGGQPAITNSENSGNSRPADVGRWDDPLPLRREIPPPEPFPVAALGDVLGAAAEAMQRIIQAPPAVCSQSLLAGAALAVQAHADLEIDGRHFPLSEFFITVADSGERKSAADREALAPHERRQRELREQFEARLVQYETEAMAWKQARQDALSSKKAPDYRAKVAALKELGGEPRPPLNPILMVEEPTYEGLVKALASGWPSMGLCSDEGGRFIGGHGMNPDNQLKTAAGLSKLWDGSPITRSRGGDGSSLLYGRRLSLHLMIQPCVARLLFDNALLSGQGLLSRCLVAWPESTIGTREYQEENLRESVAMRRYLERLLDRLNAALPLAVGQQNELEPRRLVLAPQAKQAWIGFHNHVEKLSARDKPLHPIKGLAAKAAEHAARIAGVLALIEDLSAPAVSHAAMVAGIELAQHYLSEALRLFNLARVNPDLDLAEQCLAWGQLRGGRFAMETLYQYGPNPIRDKATAVRVLKILADHSWARPLPSGVILDGKPRRNAWEVKL